MHFNVICALGFIKFIKRLPLNVPVYSYRELCRVVC